MTFIDIYGEFIVSFKRMRGGKYSLHVIYSKWWIWWQCWFYCLTKQVWQLKQMPKLPCRITMVYAWSIMKDLVVLLPINQAGHIKHCNSHYHKACHYVYFQCIPSLIIESFTRPLPRFIKPWITGIISEPWINWVCYFQGVFGNNSAELPYTANSMPIFDSVMEIGTIHF